MKNKKVIFIAFVLAALVQAYVPASMILQRQAVLEEGQLFRFETQPIDPYDPFRGRYLILDFKESEQTLKKEADFKHGETVYLTLLQETGGFTDVTAISKDLPKEGAGYLKARVRYYQHPKLSLQFPFDRYYLEEEKAGLAEVTYNQALADTSKKTWAEVYVKDGESVLHDLKVNGISVKEIIDK